MQILVFGVHLSVMGLGLAGKRLPNLRVSSCPTMVGATTQLLGTYTIPKIHITCYFILLT